MHISIMGCGWLGFPLAQQLLQEGYTVKGSTTSSSKTKILKENGIESFRIKIPDDLPDCCNSPFWKSNTLFLNIPPGRGNKNIEKNYPEYIEAVKDIIESSDSTIERVLFASSTSVYPKESGYFCEVDALPGKASRASGEAVLKAENVLLDTDKFETTILRFGGLYGYSRHPVKQLSGRKYIPSPYDPVNLIHQDDCIRIILAMLENGVESGVFNAVSDGHPPRKTLYLKAAKYYGVTPPHFDENTESVDRVISNKKLKKNLDFTFIYPNPLDYTA